MCPNYQVLFQFFMVNVSKYEGQRFSVPEAIRLSLVYISSDDYGFSLTLDADYGSRGPYGKCGKSLTLRRRGNAYRASTAPESAPKWVAVRSEAARKPAKGSGGKYQRRQTLTVASEKGRRGIVRLDVSPYKWPLQRFINDLKNDSEARGQIRPKSLRGSSDEWDIRPSHFSARSQ